MLFVFRALPGNSKLCALGTLKHRNISPRLKQYLKVLGYCFCITHLYESIQCNLTREYRAHLSRIKYTCLSNEEYSGSVRHKFSYFIILVYLLPLVKYWQVKLAFPRLRLFRTLEYIFRSQPCIISLTTNK